MTRHSVQPTRHYAEGSGFGGIARQELDDLIAEHEGRKKPFTGKTPKPIVLQGGHKNGPPAIAKPRLRMAPINVSPRRRSL
jgi:hypothetical protein